MALKKAKPKGSKLGGGNLFQADPARTESLLLGPFRVQTIGPKKKPLCVGFRVPVHLLG